MSGLWLLFVAVASLSLSKAKQCTKPGEYLYDPNDCAVFYQCDSSNVPVKSKCPSSEVWNHQILNCDFPKNVDCSRGGSPKNAHAQCGQIGEFLYDTSDCSVYYECDTNRVPRPFKCPAGNVWNHHILNCDFPANVDCTRGNNGGPYRQCSMSGEYLYDKVDCAVYYECDVNLTPLKSRCPAGENWNHDILNCDFPANVNCKRA